MTEDHRSRRAKRWLRTALITVALFAGLSFILGERATGPHRWWGAFIGSLVALGLIELLAGLRALRSEWQWKAAGGAAIGGVMFVAALLLTDSWRWVAAGAWPVAVAVAFMLLWPQPEQD